MQDDDINGSSMQTDSRTRINRKNTDEHSQANNSGVSRSTAVIKGIRLNPSSARDAVVLHEIIGPAVSRRKRTGR